MREIYPGYGSVYVEWDDRTLSDERATAWIDAALEADHDDLEEPADITVPVRYGGLDTDEVAEATGLSPDEIAEVHAAASYRVCARATVGQPMMASTDERLHVPRRGVPRIDVPALAVAVANEQATIYPVLMPGGWNVIGTALENVYDPHRDDPFLFELGDRCASSPPRASRPDDRPSAASCCPRRRSTPALRVEEAGALDLVLDGGRLNQAHHGMAQSGPLDARAARPGQRALRQRARHDADRVDAERPDASSRCATSSSAPRAAASSCEVDGEPVGQRTTRVRSGQTLSLQATGKACAATSRWPVASRPSRSSARPASIATG